MTKEQVEKLKKKHNIVGEGSTQEAIDFVAELLEMEIEDTKENYPTASRYIEHLEIAREKVISWYFKVDEDVID